MSAAKGEMKRQLAERLSCTGCAACADACPYGAIEMCEDEAGFAHPVVNSVTCKDCGACAMKCPVLAVEGQGMPCSPAMSCYAARHKDDGVRSASSSGGIFTALADSVIQDDGVVYGAAFDADFDVRHVRVETTDELEVLRGSKYVQSHMVGIYKSCRKDLQSGRRVLFSGTPCQIAALLHYLGGGHPSLLTVEVICHGVPSPAVWRKYLAEAERDIPGRRSWKIFSRDKSVSWRRYSMTIESTEARKSEIYDRNIFMRIFLANLSLRSSCFRCPFKNGRSDADFTLGDFWGIERLQSRLDDDMGVSALILHTEKAMAVWERLSSDVMFEECLLNDILAGNSAYATSVKCPSAQDYFWKHFRTSSLDKLLTRCIYGGLPRRIAIRIGRYFGRLINSVKASWQGEKTEAKR